jgi:hypothetical protein
MTNAPSMASTRLALTCPHCDAEIEVRIQTRAAVAPPLKQPVATAEEFSGWLKASRLSVEEFQRLPAYEWHRDQLEPLVKTVTDDTEGETAERGTTRPPTGEERASIG